MNMTMRQNISCLSFSCCAHPLDFRGFITTFVALAVLAGGSVARAGVGDDAITFWAGFDDQVNANQAVGSAAAATSGTVSYVDGVFGKALVVGETGATVTYSSAGNLPTTKGTIEMWIKPVNWSLVSNRYDYHHRFFLADDSNGWLQIYKFDENSFWCVRGTSTNYRTLNTVVPYAPALGRWVHLVTTWDGLVVRQYVNGLFLENELTQMPGLPAQFKVGDIPWSVRTDQTTLMDNLRIYSRPLTQAEVQGRFAEGMNSLAPKGRPAITVPKVATPATINGTVATGEWAKASLLRGLRNSDGSLQGTDAMGIEPATSVAVGSDATNLYLCFQRTMIAGTFLTADQTTQDADLSQDDSVAVEFAPGWNGTDAPTTRYRFQVNLKDTRADALVTSSNGTVTVNSTWTPSPDWTGKTSYVSNKRVTEIAIPFASLGRTAPTAKESWGVRLLTRTVVTGVGKKEAYWGGILTDTNPTAWGTFTLRPDATYLSVDTLTCSRKGVVDAKTTLSSGNATLVTAQLFAEAPGQTRQGLISQNDSTGGNNLALGVATAYSANGTIGDQLAPFLETGMIDRTTGEFLWYDQFSLNLEQGAVLDLTMRPYLTTPVGQLSVSIAGTEINADTTPVLIEVFKTGTPAAVFSNTLTSGNFTNGVAAVEVPLAGLTAGEYTVRSTVGGITREVIFNKPDTAPWIGNTVGILPDTEVPEPWTPMTVTTNGASTIVNCWQREFTFTTSPLPTQIKSQGVNLLDSYATLAGYKGSTPTTWTGSSFHIDSQSAAKVTFSGTLMQGTTTLAVTGTIEYDGMMWLKIDGNLAATSFDQLAFRLPMARSVAKYRLVFGSPSTMVVANTATWTSGLLNSIWFGNDSVGISWFTESDTDWQNTLGGNRFELTLPGSTSTIFRVNLVSGGTATAAGHFEFGLHPTPVRPRPDNWRRQAMYAYNAWVSPTMTKYHGYPMLPDGAAGTTSQATLRATAAAQRLIGKTPFPYLHSSMLSSLSPEWSYFGKEWGNPRQYVPSVANNEAAPQALYGVCPAAHDWIDFDVYNIRDYLVKVDMDGVYHDYGDPKLCTNPQHDCNNKMALLAYRELYKRIYVMLRQLGKDNNRPSYYMHHTSAASGLVVPSLISFSDAIADNEQTGAQMEFNDDLFVRDVPLEYFRIRGSGRPFGVACNFIINRMSTSLIGTGSGQQMIASSSPVATSTYAMCVVHDIVSQFGAPGYQVWGALQSFLLNFGLAEDPDIQFRGYWEGLGGATVTGGGLANTDVLMSLYVKKNAARALAVMVNRNTVARTETVTFDWASLGIPANSPVSDLVTGEIIPPTSPGSGNYTVTFAALGSRFLVAGAVPIYTDTWDGSASTNVVSLAANWVGDWAPTMDITNNLFFAGSTRTSPVLDGTNWNAGVGFGNIEFNSGAAAFNFGGNSRFTINGDVINNSTNLQTMGMQRSVTPPTPEDQLGILFPAGTTHAFNAASGNILVTGAIQFNAGTNVINKTGSFTLTLANTTQNTYSWRTNVTAGTLSIGSVASLGLETSHRTNATANNGFTVSSGATLAVSNAVTDAQITAMLGKTNFAAGSNIGFDTGLGASAGNRAYTASITDTAQGMLGLVKIGANTLTLSGTNTYTGNTIVSAGILYVSSASALPGWNTNGRFSVASGGALAVGNSFADADVTAVRGTTNFVANTGFGFDTSAGNRSFTANLTGSLGVVKIGANTLTLSGTNTYIGNTTITAGAISINATAALPGWNTNGRFSVASGATLAVYNAVVDADIATLLGTTNFAAGSSIGFDTTTANRTYSVDRGNTAQGTLGLTKLGANTLTLSGNNTYTGGTAINAGTLSLGSSNAIGTTGTISFGGGTLQATASNTTDYSSRFSTAANQAIKLDTNGQNVTWAGNLTNAGGSLTKTGVGTLTLSGNNTYTGTTFVNGGRILMTAGTIGGTTGTPQLYVGSSSGGNAAGAMRQTGGSIVLNSATSNQFLVGVGKYGAYELAGGTLQANNTDAVYRASVRAEGVFYQTGGTFNLVNAGSNSQPFQIGGVVYATGGNASITSGGTASTTTINYSGTAGAGIQLTIGGTADWNNTGVVNVANLPLNLIGTGRLTVMSLTGAGNLNFNGGTLRAGQSSTSFLTGLTATRIYSGGATIDTNGNDITVGQNLLAPTGSGLATVPLTSVGSGYIGAPQVSISGGGGTGATAVANYDPATGLITGVTITNPGTGYTSAPTVTFSTPGFTPTVAAVVGTPTIAANALTGGLTKSGNGTLTLSGTNTYTGNTTVSAGTLEIQNPAPYLDPASSVSLGASAVLNLNFASTTTITVDKLFINGVQKPAGVYGTTGSRASTPNDVNFAGLGTLTVTNGPAGANYASWASDNGISDQPFDGDFDKDGIPNGVEYALDKSPTTSSELAGVLAGNTLTFTKGAAAIANGDVSWIIETSTTLTGWTAEVTQDAGDHAATIAYTFTPGTPAKKFARLKVVQVP